MLQTVMDAEVDNFLAEHSGRRDEQGRRLVVRNGSLPEREIQTGAGKLPVRQPRVRDRSSGDDRVRFSPQVLPPYLKRYGLDRRVDPVAVPQRNFDGRLLGSPAGSCW